MHAEKVLAGQRALNKACQLGEGQACFHLARYLMTTLEDFPKMQEERTQLAFQNFVR